jgi:hypothetical protein
VSNSSAGLRAGRYELLTRLAAGGMGEVFIARQTSEGSFEKRVALKLLLPHLSQEEEFVHMFLDEARIAARMNHPNIVQIFDLGVADGRYFIAMSLVEGTSLSRLIAASKAKGEPIPLALVRLLANGLCAGLSYAHALKGPRGEDMGVIHRDVNPANVLVSTAGAVLLTDFGIAKAQDNLHRTRPGDVKGKYAYMAPEQMKDGKGVDARADLFALGATLFEALTQVSPFSRANDAATISAVREEPPPDARKLRPELPAQLVAVLENVMSKEPHERPPSARALRDAFVGDAPLASPHELGAYVERLCEKEVAAFRGAPSEAFQEVGTRALVDPVAAFQMHLAAPAPAQTAEPSPAPTVASPGTSGTFVRKSAVKRPAKVSTRRSALGFGFLAGALVVSGLAGVRFLVGRSAPVDQTPLPPLPPPAVTAADEPGRDDAAPEAEGASLGMDVRDAAHPGTPRRRAVKHARAAEPGTVAEAPRVGYLSADAKPWAAIYLGGQQLERTPMSRYPLPAGEHLLVFKNPDLGKETRRRVLIEEGKEATLRVDFTQ